MKRSWHVSCRSRYKEQRIVALAVSLPSVDQSTTRQVVDLAHQICLYSNATPNKVDLSVNVL
jgi:lipoyl-dependent peroxiredoxin